MTTDMDDDVVATETYQQPPPPPLKDSKSRKNSMTSARPKPNREASNDGRPVESVRGAGVDPRTGQTYQAAGSSEHGHGKDRRKKLIDRAGRSVRKFINEVSEPQANYPASYSSAESHGDGYYEELKKTDQSAKRYQEGRDRFAQLCEQLEDENILQREKIAALEAIIHKQQESVDKTKQSAQHMQMELDNKELFLGRQATDDEIVSSFGALLSSIKTWSTNFKSIPVDVHLFQQAITAECTQAAPYCWTAHYAKDMLSNKKRRGLFVRGLVACIISQKLFRRVKHDSQHGEQVLDLWLEPPLAAGLAVLESRLSSADQKAVTNRALNDWRALTVEMLSKTIPGATTPKSNEDFLRTLAKEVMDVTGVMTAGENVKDLEKSLYDILLSAVRLSQHLRKQRALWYLKFPIGAASSTGSPTQPTPPAFSPAIMKDELDFDDEEEDEEDEDQRPQYVELVVSPALCKRGNSDGERFDEEYAVVPASVLTYRSQPRP